MGNPESVYRSASGRRLRRRRQLAVGAVALAAILGGGAYAMSGSLRRDAGTLPAEPGAFAPIAPPSATPSSSPAEPPSGPLSLPPPVTRAKSAARHSISPAVPSPGSSAPAPSSAAARSLDERIEQQLSAAGTRNDPGVTIRGEHRDNGSLRIITARSDLAGQRELGWAGDSGRRVGDVRCTQRLHFSGDAAASFQPNLLLCWRTSAARSVVTLRVDYGGHPSAADSVAVIAREWAALS